MNRKQFLKPFLLAAAGVASLIGCGDTIIEATGTHSIQTTATLSVVVRDAVTGALVEGATVALLSEEKTTASNGNVSFEKVHAGFHKVYVTAPDYGPIVHDVNVTEFDRRDDDNFIAHEVMSQAFIHPLTASVEGVLYYTDGDGTKHEATGAKVRFEINDDRFANRKYDANVVAGKFTIPNLPAGEYSFSIFALEHKFGDNIYRTKEISYGYKLDAGINKNLAISLWALGDDDRTAFKILRYNRVVTYTEPVVFVFNDVVDTLRTDINTVAINGQIFQRNWTPASAPNTLTLTPLGGEWNSAISQMTVVFNGLFSANTGKELMFEDRQNNTITVRFPDLSGTSITAITDSTQETIHVGSHQIKLRWNKVERATKYSVYRKIDGEYDYTYVGETGNANDTVQFFSLVGSGVINTKAVTFRVRAHNATSQTPFGTQTLEVSAVPTVVPSQRINDGRYTINHGILAGDVTDALSSRSQSDIPFTINFTEEMDTNQTFANLPAAGRLSLREYEWVDAKTLRIFLRVAEVPATEASPQFAQIDHTFSIPRLKAQRASVVDDFEIKYPGAISTDGPSVVRKTTIDLRFRGTQVAGI